MFGELWKRQLVDDIKSSKFLINFIIILASVIGFSLLFLDHFQSLKESYSKNANANDQLLAESSSELVRLLSTPLVFMMKPGPFLFISDGYEEKIPRGLAFKPEGYTPDIRETPRLRKAWAPDISTFYSTDFTFVVQFLLSFFALLLTFDTLTSEKEKGTLRLVFSNPVKRVHLILAKYMAALITIGLPLLLGLIVGLILISLSSIVPVSSAFVLGLLLFFGVSFLYLSVFILIGLLFSASSYSSKNSLVLGLLIWIFLVIVLPKSSGLFLNLKRFDVPTEQEVEERVRAVERDVWNRHSGEDTMARSGQDESTKLNVAVSNEEQRARQEIYDLYLRKKIDAVRVLQSFNFVSPASLYEYSASALAGTGLFHFEHLWKQVTQYRRDVLNFFMAEDKKDDQSDHLYFHPDYLSRKPVDFNRIPKFEETDIATRERLKDAAKYLLLLGIYNIFLLTAVFYKFQKYDVR
jgi:ABC-type transport system involved in multi-copper enzyme maturation permease subunit